MPTQRAVLRVPGVQSVEVKLSAEVNRDSRLTDSKSLPPGIKNIIAVASGKGGVGKSTVALNLAAALARRPARVGLLDADLYGPDIPRMLGLSRDERAGKLDLWIRGDPKKNQAPIVERYGIKVASVQFLIAEDQSISFNSAMVGLLLKRLVEADWGELDFLIIDLPPGTADIQQQVAGMVDLAGVVVVVTPQDVAHLDSGLGGLRPKPRSGEVPSSHRPGHP